jgi:hypothetical protein
MPSESVARVIRDIRLGRVTDPTVAARTHGPAFIESAAQYRQAAFNLAQDSPVIDIQPIYDAWMGDDDGTEIYKHLAAPPWETALMGYVNNVGNVTVMQMIAVDYRDPESGDIANWEGHRWQPGDSDDEGASFGGDEHIIDWDNVRWMNTVCLYLGGRVSTGAPIPTMGPAFIWRIPVYADGEIADIRWFQTAGGTDRDMFDNAIVSFLRTLDICNSVNVVVATPERSYDRATRRRMERTGVRFSEIHIRPVSKSYRGLGTPLSDVTTPLSSVRGHAAEYGPKYGKGLLFGKYEGRYWIPQHLRGSAEAGEVEQTYVVER